MIIYSKQRATVSHKIHGPHACEENLSNGPRTSREEKWNRDCDCPAADCLMFFVVRLQMKFLPMEILLL